MNKVIRQCNRCGFQQDQNEAGFTYLDDDVWSCQNCGSKYIHISKVLGDDESQNTGENNDQGFIVAYIMAIKFRAIRD